MGCFLTNGFISHLPIMVDDPIYGFICIKKHGNLCYEYLTPIYLPLKGAYDDYGRIYQIEPGPEVSLLEELAGFPIDRIIKLIYKGYANAEYESEFDDADYLKLRQNLITMPLFDNGYDLCITIEHRDVIDTLADLMIKPAEASYECAVKNIALLEDYYNYHYHNELFFQKDSSEDENVARVIEGMHKSDDAQNKYLKCFNQLGSRRERYMNINPEFNSGYYSVFRDEFRGDYLLWILRLKHDAWMNPKFKDSYIKMMSLYITMFEMGLNFTMSLWQGQELERAKHKKLVASYNRVLKAQGARKKDW